MSATLHLPPNSWTAAHRVLLTAIAIALALALALSIAFVVSQKPGGGTLTPGGSVNHNSSGPDLRCIRTVCAK